MTIVHTDFTLKKLAKLLREHPGEVELVSRLKVEQWYVLRAVKPGVRVRDLCKQYQIGTLWEFRQRSRQQINKARQKGTKI